MPERKRAPHVVLVEDDDIDAMAVQRAFKRGALEVELVRFRSGEEALEGLRAEEPRSVARPFVVLLDLNMPGIGGHGFLDELRADAELQTSVVFVLTTSSAARDLERAYDRQVAGYFVKDIASGRNEKLVETLRSYLDSSWLLGDV